MGSPNQELNVYHREHMLYQIIFQRLVNDPKFNKIELGDLRDVAETTSKEIRHFENARSKIKTEDINNYELVSDAQRYRPAFWSIFVTKLRLKNKDEK